MKATIHAVVILLFAASSLFASQTEQVVKLTTKTGTLEGSLLVPKGKTNIPVVLIIAGSGPTDRDGNNPIVGKNNSLKMLAYELLRSEIASLRYDKRAIGKSKKAGLKEIDLRFDAYVEDAAGWIDLLKKDKRFNQIIVIGHSEGSLIGMIASQKRDVDKFISIAGPGQPAGDLIREQLKDQPAIVVDPATRILDKLVEGKTVENVPAMLNSIFRTSFQPYMISWFKYDPRKEISKLKKPVLIIQGSTDIQVAKKDAEMLAKANPKAELRIIEGMNHIFKKAGLDKAENFRTYSQPELPIEPKMVNVIVGFVGKRTE